MEFKSLFSYKKNMLPNEVTSQNQFEFREDFHSFIHLLNLRLATTCLKDSLARRQGGFSWNIRNERLLGCKTFWKSRSSNIYVDLSLVQSLWFRLVISTSERK